MKQSRAPLAIQLGLALCAAFAHPAQAEDVVRLGNLKFVHYGAVAYMKEACPKYGIRIEEKIFAKGPEIMPAVREGQIDLAALASDGAIAGRAHGVPIYAVAGFAKGGARIVARVNNNIKTVADLKGRKVGVTRGGAQELLLLAELEKAGLSWSDKPGKDVQIVYLPFKDLNQALLLRRIDAMCQSEPQSSQAINLKFGEEIIKPYDTPMGQPYRLLVMSEKLYARKELAQRVMNCFVDATATFKRDPALAEAYVIERFFQHGIGQNDFSDAMSNAEFTYELSPKHVEITTEYMGRYGVGDMPQLPRTADWVKLDLLQQAKNALGVK